ncbi:GntR family transcriptional regulator [Rhodococcus sp. WMMA185]|uniref:GntR family transcriptional regulator n=1 Tax=Rhodococcus sp. WMMA185 TaxID=679318 RepID=UPI0008781BCE|nr:GntR family transcriptional regulator [Rhodococcus sp. WMMA185]AOW93068.1 GntR family transcriptional regulator [Rhodococcus sp. WMMA185]
MIAEHLQDSVIPKHEQLRAILLHKCTKELEHGDLMTSERQLMQDYGVSRITVREAIGQLVNEGYLVRVRGKGTFVAPRPVQSKLHLASFTEEMRAQGHAPTTVVLLREEDTVPAATAKALHLALDTRAYHVKRLRLADGEPMSVDDGWFNATLLPGLIDLDLTGSIYRATSDRYDMPIERAEQSVSADGASSEIATLLGIKRGAPVMHFDRVSFSGQVPIEHTRSWYRSDRYQLQMEVQGNERARRSV